MVRHFLKDGRQVESVAGKIISSKDFEPVYTIIHAINERANNGINGARNRNVEKA